MKVSFLKVVLFIFLKYIVFYVFRAIKLGSYGKTNFTDANAEGWFYFIIVFLALPVVCTILFAAPIYFSFNIRNNGLFTIALVAILIAEYFVYVYLTSDRHIDINGVYNGIISLIFFLIFFIIPLGKWFKKSAS